MMAFLHTGATPWLSLMAGWCSIGETHRGQQGMAALTLPQVRYGLSRLLAVFYTPGIDDICRQVHGQCNAQQVGSILPSLHP